MKLSNVLPKLDNLPFLSNQRKNVSHHRSTTSKERFLPNSKDSSKRITFDLQLLIAAYTLVALGLFIVYDVSIVHAYRDFGDSYSYIRQQLIWVLLGSVCLFFFSVFPYQKLKKIALAGLLMSIILLLGVFIPGLGDAAGGAHRWLRIGPVSLQPTEVVKLASIIFFASIFEKGYRFGPFVLLLGVITIIIGILQKDLGSSIVFFLNSVALFIISGAPMVYFLILAPVTVVSFIIFVLTSAYRQKRILAFLDPFSDPQGFTYHISQILIALGTGHFLGLGLGQSRQKFEFIPEITTDSIFAVVGEEFGFVGSFLLITLFAFLIHRGFKIASSAPNKFGQMLAFGLTFWIGIQTAINLGAMVSLIPLTGVPLPFISYGGSALLVNLVAIGILLNISKNR